MLAPDFRTTSYPPLRQFSWSRNRDLSIVACACKIKQTHTPKWNIALTRGGRYSAAFKQEVAIEALKGTKTIQQIASDYTLSSDVVKGWKKQAREMMEEGFKRKGKKKTKEAELEAKIGHLEILLGQREFELDWLTKKSKELGL